MILSEYLFGYQGFRLPNNYFNNDVTSIKLLKKVGTYKQTPTVDPPKYKLYTIF